jgi:hypothetical protein
MPDVLPMSALKFSNPVIFSVGMVPNNLSFHVNIIAWVRAPEPEPLPHEDGTAARSKVAPTSDSRTTLRPPRRLGFAWWPLVLDMAAAGCVQHWIAK